MAISTEITESQGGTVIRKKATSVEFSTPLVP
jgi:hypothetical protein